MRVICIEATDVGTFYESGRKSSDTPTLKEGGIYNVVDEDIICGCGAYQLEEFGTLNYFEKSIFIPLSNISETELVTAKDLIEWVK